MSQWLNKMRNKPKSVKDQYAFFGSVVITSLIAGVWLMSFQAPAASVATDEAPFSETKSAFGQFFASTKEQLAQVLSSNKDESESDATTATTTATTTKAAPQAVIIPTLTASTTPRIGVPIIISTTTTASTSQQ